MDWPFLFVVNEKYWLNYWFVLRIAFLFQNNTIKHNIAFGMVSVIGY